MGGKKIKIAKRCSICGKILRHWNKSGLCTTHGIIDRAKKRRTERRNKGLCISCGKPVEKIALYNDSKGGKPIITIIKTPSRCSSCRELRKKYDKAWKQKKKNAEVVTTKK